MSAKHASPVEDQGPAIATMAASIRQRLGSPTGIFKILVHHLWDDRFRINVLMGPDVISARVAHSYFVVADAKGNILSSIPHIGPSA